MRKIKGKECAPPCELHGKVIMRVLDMISEIDKRLLEVELRYDANRTPVVQTKTGSACTN